MNRELEQKKWLSNFIGGEFEVHIASEDASFRKYYRIITSRKTYILMDAPPKIESLSNFLSLGQAMFDKNLKVPRIYQKSEQKGFILLEDFGSNTFFEKCKKIRKKNLYIKAIDKIIDMQLLLKINNLDKYSKTILLKEMRLFDEWYLKQNKTLLLKNKEQTDLNAVLNNIVANNLLQEIYFVHRDFHSRNLMILDNNDIGILDFQDAVMGPITYDLVSLLKDAYIELEEEDIIDLVIKYWERAIENNLLQKGDFADFFMQFELMGVQRHLKVLGIFSRLSIRDKKDNYLKNIPLVEKYLLQAAGRYEFLKPLKKILLRCIDG